MSPKCLALTALFTLFISVAASAETLVLKFASLAPKGSAWDLSFRETDEKWRAASGNTVRMRIFSGTLGDESDIMRRNVSTAEQN